MEMVIGLPCFESERPNKHGRAERCRDGSKLLNGFCVIEKNIADTINICGATPGMNALRAADLMRWRPVATIRADENRPIDFATKVFQKSRQ